MNQYTTEREIAGIRYTIRELTTSDVRAWLKQLEQASVGTSSTWRGRAKRWLMALLYRFGLASKPIPAGERDVVDVMLFEGFVMFDIRFITSLTEDDIGKLTPRQIRAVWAACQEVNEDFFRFRRNLETVGIASPAMSAVISNELSRS